MAVTPLPLTYPDLVCDLDVDPFASETTSDLQNLIQDVYHLLLEYPGSNLDDPQRGIGVEQYLSSNDKQFSGLPGIIDTQLSEDERIDSSNTTLTQNNDGTFLLKVQITVGVTVVPLEFGWQAGQFTNLSAV